MDNRFRRMRPKSIVLPSLVMTISYKNTKKKSVSSVLIKAKSDIDKARKTFTENFSNHDKESIDKIALDLCQYNSPFMGIDSVDFNDEEELNDLFFTFKIEYDEMINGPQE